MYGNTYSVSNHSTQSSVQDIQSAIRSEMSPFLQATEQELQATQTVVPLTLNVPQLALFANSITGIYQSVALIVDESYIKEHIEPMLLGWQEFLQSPKSWHIISHPLSDQEKNGDITTALSRGYHQMFSSTSSNNFLITTTALSSPPPDKKAYQGLCLQLAVGEMISQSDLVGKLVKIGYIRHQTSLSPGTFRVRGDIVDIAHPIDTGHISLHYLGNTIEQLVRHIDRRSQTVSSTTILPNKFPETTGSWNAFFEDSLLLKPEQYSAFQGKHTITINSPKPWQHFPFIPVATSEETKPVYVIYSNRNRIDAFSKEHEQDILAMQQSSLGTLPISLETSTFRIKTEAAIFPEEVSSPSAAPLNYERALELIASLQEQRPVVHADHGIGIYEGLERKVIEDIEKEYLVIRYAEGDSLYVPVEYAHKVSPYVGNAHPIIHRLGGTGWATSRKKAQEDAIEFAKELLNISRKRIVSTRTPYSTTQTVEEKLEESFPYTLTVDQVQAWQEIQADLKKDVPMDRLLVGDVGFGKTEIAIRATYHVFSNEKQVALLAPTTLLVQQHFDTFQQRLPHNASDIFLLSRFASRQQQKEAMARIESGKPCIIIGTHALLSSKIVWKNLGLLIVDEEQRFGVRQKEHFKKLRSSVDMLALSATPIPRTLSMALSGLRSLSIIATPPEGRKSIHTVVKKRDDTIIQEAIIKEISRGGQVYVVSRKIRNLGTIREEIASLVPDARIAIAHAQLPDSDLSKVIHQFDTGEIDVLVSSSIVENGLDLPNANTMIVWNATQFGLAELYQLRGRVGRRDRQAYAYFLYNQEKLTFLQRERLTALTESTRLGSGWEIARRDLEIRGAGNLLGSDQSGSVQTVGVELYLEMVHQATEEQSVPSDVSVSLPLSALLPASYIPDSSERARWYRRLSRSKNESVLLSHQKELETRYGSLPTNAHNLMLLIQLQLVAGQHSITKIRYSNVKPTDEDPYYRIEIEGNDLPNTLRHLQTLGNWEVRHQTLTWDVDTISPALIERFIEVLKKG